MDASPAPQPEPESEPEPEPEPEDHLPAGTSPVEPARRASDTDRERAAAAVRAAAADGRISFDELDERLGSVFLARTTDELTSFVDDLQPARRATGAPTSSKDTSILSELVRIGRWTVGDTYRATAVISSGVIDLRQAQFTGTRTTVHVTSWLGTVYVVVPDDAEVHAAGTGIVGSFTQDRDSTSPSDALQITVTGVAVAGSVHVVHQLPDATSARLRKRERKQLGRRSPP